MDPYIDAVIGQFQCKQLIITTCPLDTFHMPNLEECPYDVEFQIISDSQSIMAHRSIVSGANEAINEFIMSNNPMVIYVDNVSTNIYDVLIKSCYKYDFVITRENVRDLMAAATRFTFKFVKMKCIEFITRNLTVANCVPIWNWAQRDNIPLLRQVAMHFMQYKFTEIIQTVDLRMLNVDCFNTLLRSNDLLHTHESDVMDALFEWLETDLITRSEYAVSLMMFIRTTFITIDNIVDKFINGCMEEQIKAEMWTAMEQQRDQLVHPQRRSFTDYSEANLLLALHSSLLLEYAICVGGEICSRDVFGNLTSRWTGFTIAFSNNTLYIIGGNEGSQACAVTLYIELTSDTLFIMETMTTERAFFPAVVYENFIYVFGGRQGDVDLPCVEKMDTSIKRWISVPQMPTARSDAFAVVCGNNIYVMGGRIGSTITKVVQCFDPQLNVWYEVAPMLINKEVAQSVVAFGNIYVFDCLEEGNIMAIQVYFPIENYWCLFSVDVGMSWKSYGVAALGPYIYIVGGCKSQSGMVKCKLMRLNAATGTSSIQDFVPWKTRNNRLCLITFIQQGQTIIE